MNHPVCNVSILRRDITVSLANAKSESEGREKVWKVGSKMGIYIYECLMLEGESHAKGIAAELKPNRPAVKSQN